MKNLERLLLAFVILIVCRLYIGFNTTHNAFAAQRVVENCYVKPDMGKKNITDNCGEEKVLLPAIMYHSVNKANIGDYVVHPESLERDFINLNHLGYTTVFTKEIVEFCKGERSLPEKPILITFDDGFYNNFTYVLPLLKKYKVKAVFAVVGSFTNNERGQRQSNYYSNLNREQIAELYKSGYAEIANHTYELHGYRNGRKGAARKSNESYESYRDLLKTDLFKTQRIIAETCGIEAKVFAYPYGSYDISTIEVLKECGFDIALTCNERVNVISRGCGLFEIGRFNRKGSCQSEEFFRKIDKECKSLKETA